MVFPWSGSMGENQAICRCYITRPVVISIFITPLSRTLSWLTGLEGVQCKRCTKDKPRRRRDRSVSAVPSRAPSTKIENRAGLCTGKRRCSVFEYRNLLHAQRGRPCIGLLPGGRPWQNCRHPLLSLLPIMLDQPYAHVTRPSRGVESGCASPNGAS